MDEKIFKDAFKQARENSPKRNFKQSFDIIINLKGLDLKKPEHQVDFFMQLDRGKKAKICALVGAELIDEARKNCDHAILQDDFAKYAEDKKLAKKLSEQYDFFIAQANIMPKIAAAFGRVLGPRGKMPNPKAGCIVPPKANLKPVYDKLQKTVRINAKLIPIVQTMVGKEDADDSVLAKNAFAVYDQVLHHLPGEKNNIDSLYVKLTMGKPIKVSDAVQKEASREKKKLFHKKKEEKKAEAVQEAG